MVLVGLRCDDGHLGDLHARRTKRAKLFGRDGCNGSELFGDSHSVRHRSRSARTPRALVINCPRAAKPAHIADMIENAVYLIRYNQKVPKELFSRSLISLARRKAKISQAELARRAKTSQAAISMYEAGTRSPTLDTLLRIIRAAGSDLRIGLSGPDTHTITRERFEKTLDPKVLKEFNAKERERVRLARLGR